MRVMRLNGYLSEKKRIGDFSREVSYSQGSKEIASLQY